MKAIALAVLLAMHVEAGLPAAEVERIVDAIYIAEGGARASVPYGILSVHVSSEAEARRVCRRTVVNTYDRWLNAGRPGQWIDFLGDRYCPASVSTTGNRNWKRNMKKLLR
jgi:hypothetical protein